MTEDIHKLELPEEQATERQLRWYLFKDRIISTIKRQWGIRHILDAWYYTKCALWHKYNCVKVKSLPPTWIDRSDLLPYVMFQLLEDFVAKECSLNSVDWDTTERHRAARNKMDELLAWWKHYQYEMDHLADGKDESKATLPEEMYTPVHGDDGKIIGYSLAFNDYERDFYRQVSEKETRLENELTEKLKELIDIRGYLWT